MTTDRKQHWENVYTAKTPEQVSWTQDIPSTSLNLIEACKLPPDARIIDIGGGESKLVDNLLSRGFQQLSVLDISSVALEKAKQRLGANAGKVEWITVDITNFEPVKTYDLWHDRATFHFLTNQEQIDHYIGIIKKAVTGYLIIATFSNNGPKKCSGLNVQQYSETSLTALWENDFEKIDCFTEDHVTPFNTTQNFLFCLFKKRNV